MLQALCLVLAAVVAAAQDTDVALSIKPDVDGTSQLGFFVYGGSGSDFVLTNNDQGSLKLQSGELVVLDVNNGKPTEGGGGGGGEEEDKDKVALLELDSFRSEKTRSQRREERDRALLGSIHTERKKLMQERRRKSKMSSARHLLTMDELLVGEGAEPVGTLAEGTGAPAYQLAESISAPGKIKVSGNIASTSSGNVKVCGHKQWKMILHDDFHKGTVQNWEVVGKGEGTSEAPVDTCAASPHPNSDYFLGPFDEPVEAVKSFLLPPHSRLKVEARVHFIDKWEGQSIYMKVNGQIVWLDQHRWCTKLLITMCEPKAAPEDDGMTISSCGQPTFPDRMSVAVQVELAHTQEALKISFGSSLEEGQDVAAWGADDLKIFIR